jgi:hypothetical protein
MVLVVVSSTRIKTYSSIPLTLPKHLSVGGKCNPNPVSVVFNIAVVAAWHPQEMRMLMAMMMKMCGK